jgi:UDP-N-acetylmuramate--alanine ligase
MLQMGYEVTGSDVSASNVTRELEAAGATIWIGHDERYARIADMVIYSTAIPETNPELSYAREHGKPLLNRIEFLTYLADRSDAVVISGSHGKSTTTSLLASAFIAAQKDPTVVLGSVLKNVGSARMGKSKFFLCEGDESNNSILHFTPKVAVVTNIDCDHLDFHGSLSNLKESFIRFLNSPRRGGFSVVCLDDENIRSIVPRLEKRVLSYGFHPDALYRAEARRKNSEGGLSFEVHHKEDGPLGEIDLRLPGDHNIQNALATVVISRELGLNFGHIQTALETFPGVCRRYDIYYNNGVKVIDDYAHHPSEIQALISSVRELSKGRVRVVFQPHRFTRSKILAQQFPGAFVMADEIILAPIYTAHEKPIAGIGVDYLNRFFQRQYDESKLQCLSDFDEITNYITDTLEPDDVVLTVGAGDIYHVAERLKARLDDGTGLPAPELDLKRIQAEFSSPSMFED